MKYQFSYQKVLDFKEKEKEMAQNEYGTLKRKQMEVQQQLAGLEAHKEDVFNQFNHVGQKTVRDILEVQEEMNHVNRQMNLLVSKSQEIHQEVEQKQQLLIEKSKEAKMWNQWKSKSKAAFQKQMDQREQAMLDEMAVLRYSRRV